jgi:hypothetical protein
MPLALGLWQLRLLAKTQTKPKGNDLAADLPHEMAGKSVNSKLRERLIGCHQPRQYRGRCR